MRIHFIFVALSVHSSTKKRNQEEVDSDSDGDGQVKRRKMETNAVIELNTNLKRRNDDFDDHDGPSSEKKLKMLTH